MSTKKKEYKPTNSINAYKRGSSIVVQVLDAEGQQLLPEIQMSYMTACKLHSDLNMALAFLLKGSS